MIINHQSSISGPFLIHFSSNSYPSLWSKCICEEKPVAGDAFRLSAHSSWPSSMDSNSVLATLANRVDAARRASCSVLSGLERVKYGCVDLLLITNVWWWQLFFEFFSQLHDLRVEYHVFKLSKAFREALCRYHWCLVHSPVPVGWFTECLNVFTFIAFPCFFWP